MKKAKSKNEFRTHNSNKNKNHPTFIFAKVGKKYKFVGITHAEITDGMKNIPLLKNPNPKDKKPSYFRPFFDDDYISSFGKKKKGWKLYPEDKLKIPKNKKKKN